MSNTSRDITLEVFLFWISNKKTASKSNANGVYLNKILYQDCILHGMC